MSLADPPGAGGGEANTSSNVGTGQGLAKTKTGVDLPFKSLVAGSARLTLTGNTNDVTIDVPSGAFETAGAVATHEAAADPHTGYQKESEKDAANGYAGLSASTKLAGAQQTYGTSANTAAEGNDTRITGAVQGPASATDNAIARFDTTTGKLVQNSASTIDDNGTIAPVACAAGYPSVSLTAGTVMTTPTAGAVEMDANCVYITTDAGNRGYVRLSHLLRQDAAYTLSSVGTAQNLFNAATNGRITLETGTYRFEALIALSAMSATSGNATFSLAGTATLGGIIWHGFGRDIAADGATGTLAGSYSTDATLTAAPLVTAGTATAMFAKLEGTFEVTGAGTLIPQITLQTAAAAAVGIGSFFEVWRIGSTSMTVVGQWD